MAKKPDQAKKPAKPDNTKVKQSGRNRGATKDAYTGRSGQLAVMAELLMLKCNVAIPEVDEGRDVFAFKEGRPEIAHLQVKTAQGKRYKREVGYSAQFSIPKKELRGPSPQPPIHYALAARVGADWANFLIIRRDQMADYYWDRASQMAAEGEGSGDFVFTVQFRPQQVLCGQIDLTTYRDAWETLPPFRPPLDVSSSRPDTGEASHQPPT